MHPKKSRNSPQTSSMFQPQYLGRPDFLGPCFYLFTPALTPRGSPPQPVKPQLRSEGPQVPVSAAGRGRLPSTLQAKHTAQADVLNSGHTQGLRPGADLDLGEGTETQRGKGANPPASPRRPCLASPVGTLNGPSRRRTYSL